MAGSVIREGPRAASGDAALVDRAADGDQVAYEALIGPRLDGLYQTALSILRHDADARDVVQNACVRAWTELPRLRDVERLDAWLGRILVNACRDRLRSRKRTTIREIDVASLTGSADEPSARSAPVADHVVQKEGIRRAFLRLRPDDRVLLGLHHAQLLHIDEIAELVGAPAGTVKWRLHQARKALARALELELER